MFNYILKLLCCIPTKKEYNSIKTDVNFEDYFE